MDGRLFTVIFLFVVPAALIGVTIGLFHSNPVAIFALFVAMLVGAFYLLTYRESFA